MSFRHLIISGSPRSNGKSVRLAERLAERHISADDTVTVEVFEVSSLSIGPCRACDTCRDTGACIVHDDMDELYRALDEADAVTVVSPLYFAGPPAQFKAVLDRFQRYFWSRDSQAEKRPVDLYIIGDGGDPHGFDPLVTIVKSAFAVAGFKLADVRDCVGLSNEELDRIADAAYAGTSASDAS